MGGRGTVGILRVGIGLSLPGCALLAGAVPSLGAPSCSLSSIWPTLLKEGSVTTLKHLKHSTFPLIASPTPLYSPPARLTITEIPPRPIISLITSALITPSSPSPAVCSATSCSRDHHSNCRPQEAYSPLPPLPPLTHQEWTLNPAPWTPSKAPPHRHQKILASVLRTMASSRSNLPSSRIFSPHMRRPCQTHQMRRRMGGTGR